MAKLRKTREQKIAAAQRYHQVAQHLTYSLNNVQSTQSITKDKTSKVLSHTYVYTNKDLQKTCIISFTLIALELLLYLLLHQHILKMPWAIY